MDIIVSTGDVASIALIPCFSEGIKLLRLSAQIISMHENMQTKNKIKWRAFSSYSLVV
jgi:hypothetical protein